MYPNLEGFNVKEVTLYKNGDIKPGMAIMITDNYTATIPTSNTRFAGICTAVRGDYISAALTGIVTVHYTGTDLVTGYNGISSDGNGNVKLDVNATTEHLILDVNKEDKLITFLL